LPEITFFITGIINVAGDLISTTAFMFSPDSFEIDENLVYEIEMRVSNFKWLFFLALK
jgi:hypothetical protein